MPKRSSKRPPIDPSIIDDLKDNGYSNAIVFIAARSDTSIPDKLTDVHPFWDALRAYTDTIVDSAMSPANRGGAEKISTAKTAVVAAAGNDVPELGNKEFQEIEQTIRGEVRAAKTKWEQAATDGYLKG